MLQKMYRGRVGRKLAEEKRVELADFIYSMRLKEAKEMEETYYETHAWDRYKRDYRETKTMIKKMLIKTEAQVQSIATGQFVEYREKMDAGMRGLRVILCISLHILFIYIILLGAYIVDVEVLLPAPEWYSGNVDNVDTLDVTDNVLRERSDLTPWEREDANEGKIARAKKIEKTDVSQFLENNEPIG
jgi:hypothetical protein